MDETTLVKFRIFICQILNLSTEALGSYSFRFTAPFFSLGGLASGHNSLLILAFLAPRPLGHNMNWMVSASRRNKWMFDADRDLFRLEYVPNLRWIVFLGFLGDGKVMVHSLFIHIRGGSRTRARNRAESTQTDSS